MFDNSQVMLYIGVGLAFALVFVAKIYLLFLLAQKTNQDYYYEVKRK